MTQMSEKDFASPLKRRLETRFLIRQRFNFSESRSCLSCWGHNCLGVADQARTSSKQSDFVIMELVCNKSYNVACGVGLNYAARCLLNSQGPGIRFGAGTWWTRWEREKRSFRGQNAPLQVQQRKKGQNERDIHRPLFFFSKTLLSTTVQKQKAIFTKLWPSLLTLFGFTADLIIWKGTQKKKKRRGRGA